MTGATELSIRGEHMIEGFEGGMSADGLYRAYWDSFGHVWTIGVGETRINGQPVRPGTVWTQAQAFGDLRDRFNRDFAPSIRSLGVDLNPNQFDGLGSFLWNEGAGAVEWDVGRYIRAHEFEAAGRAMLQYDTAGGQRLSALVSRREVESRVFLTPWVEPVPPDPHHYHLYPDRLMIFEGHKFHERGLAQQIDHFLEHPHLHHPGLHRDLPLAITARKRIWVVSVFEAPEYQHKRAHADWGDFRGPRYQFWDDRIKRIERELHHHSL